MLTKNKYLNTAYFLRKNQLVNLFLFISEKHKFYVNLPNFSSLITTKYSHERLINFAENNNGFIKSIILSNSTSGVFSESVLPHSKHVV